MERVASITVAAALLSSCGLTPARVATHPLPGDVELSQLWIEPDDLAARDLLWGPGGEKRAPRPEHSYRIIELDETGYSSGYEVIGPDGREWKVKLGPEAQSEIVASRLLWAIGFHQPAMYTLDSWRLEGSVKRRSETARFRLKDGYRTRGNWSWHENPFVGTREFRGLLVAQLLLNNWDLKGTNNRVYAVGDGESGPRTWFVVQDLGASLGRPRWPTGSRSNVSTFEQHPFITGFDRNGMQFGYPGRHRELYRAIEPSDVVWTCRLLAQLTDRQWHDAFRAGRYGEEEAVRFIATLRAKIQQGLALMPLAGDDF